MSERNRAKDDPVFSSARVITYLIIAVAVIAAAIAAIVLSRGWKYDSYRVLRSEKQEDTISSSYANLNDNVLQYSSEFARLRDRQGEDIWSVNYSVRTPELAVCGDTVAVYDKDGTDVVVIDGDGRKTTFASKLPIVKACVSSDGNVAVIQENESNAWIDYYTRDGSEIASIKTSMDDPGYPVALSVTPDGGLLAVSYISFTEGIQQGLVHVYSFGPGGENQMDNRIAAFTYDQRVVPELAFLDSRTLAVFRDNGFTIYEGAKVPKAVKEVVTDRDIYGIFHDQEHIGLILDGDEDGTYTLSLYNRSGSELFSGKTDFPCERAEIRGDEISLYHGAALRVYSISGSEKYDGSYDGEPRDFFAIGKHRYVAVTDTALELIQLH